MKVVHINTFAGGGAGTAASRLHEELLQQGVDSSFVCMEDKSVTIKNSITLPFAHPTLWNKIRNKLNFPVMAEHIKEHLIDKYQPQCEFLGTPYSDYKVEELAVVQEADIINLNWVTSFINYPTFFKKINKPIVWTIHDLSAFMGCFNYPIEQINNPKMKMIDSIFYKEKIAALKEYNYQIHIVAPSEWIMEEAQKYMPFATLSYHHIPNGIDRKKINYIDTYEAREKLGLPKDVCILLFVCENIENKRKRFDRVLDLVQKFSDSKILFVAVGDQLNISPNEHINFVGKVKSLEKLNLYYAAANYFLIPSEEDNFPNVVLESLFCGTPVISNNVGGMKDIINESNGFLVDEFDIFEITNIIQRTINKELIFDKKQISENITNTYSVSKMANEYLELYKSLL